MLSETGAQLAHVQELERGRGLWGSGLFGAVVEVR